MSFEEKSKWLRQNPITPARHFQYRLSTFFQTFLKSKAHPLGELVVYAIQIEFQARGSLHAHTILWTNDAPKLGVDSDKDVCKFIDQYNSCSIPEDADLAHLVTKCQKHRHSATCIRMVTSDSTIPVLQVLWRSLLKNSTLVCVQATRLMKHSAI